MMVTMVMVVITSARSSISLTTHNTTISLCIPHSTSYWDSGRASGRKGSAKKNCHQNISTSVTM